MNVRWNSVSNVNEEDKYRWNIRIGGKHEICWLYICSYGVQVKFDAGKKKTAPLLFMCDSEQMRQWKVAPKLFFFRHVFR